MEESGEPVEIGAKVHQVYGSLLVRIEDETEFLKLAAKFNAPAIFKHKKSMKFIHRHVVYEFKGRRRRP